MSKLMLKMFADMAGIKPEDILKSVEEFQTLAHKGVQTLENIDIRLANLETATSKIMRHLDIADTGQIIANNKMERHEHGEEIGT